MSNNGLTTHRNIGLTTHSTGSGGQLEDSSRFAGDISKVATRPCSSVDSRANHPVRWAINQESKTRRRGSYLSNLRGCSLITGQPKASLLGDVPEGPAAAASAEESARGFIIAYFKYNLRPLALSHCGQRPVTRRSRLYRQAGTCASYSSAP